MAIINDRRPKLHVAGSKPTAQQDQICIRCYTVMAKPGTTGWPAGRTVSSDGRGNWSVQDESNPSVHRLCGRENFPTRADIADAHRWAKEQTKAEREFVKAFTENKYGELM